MKKQQIKTKSFYILAVFFSFSILVFSFVYAQDSDNPEQILNFNGEIKVNSDSTINVREIIKYDFGENEKHGIFRTIPIKYKARGGSYNLRLTDIKVTDENGRPYNFAVSYPGQDIEIKIGDAGKLVEGIKTYAISYTVRRAVNYFSDHDELYWNFTGDQWQVPIKSASVRLNLPGLAGENLQYKCFQGVFGSTDECGASASGNTIEYKSTKALRSGEGLTIVASWPKGITAQPTFWQKFSSIIFDNWSVFVPVVIFAAMFLTWYRKGRDPKGRGTIVAQYEPPNGLSPAEIATVLHGNAKSGDVSATIIDLAVRGYIKIKRIEEKSWLGSNVDYEFTKLKEDLPSRDFEETIMDGIFKAETANVQRLSDLKNKFYKYLGIVQEKLYKRITSGGYYVSNPRNVRIIWIIAAIISGIMMTIVLGALQSGYGAASGIVSGAIMLIFGWLMPAVTTKGAEAKENILGFREFLSVTETDRLKFHNAPARIAAPARSAASAAGWQNAAGGPEKNSEMFEKFLPYAMVMGVEKEWAHQFEGIYNQQPEWYEDSSGRAFSAVMLSNFVSDFSSSAVATLSSQPSSASGGGSGFSGGGSGGGFGGGGGGSW